MKKLLILPILLFLTACTPGEEVTCTIDGKEAIFTLKNGMVSSYKLDGNKKSQNIVDEINGEYFTSAKNNEEGKIALKNYVSSQNGSCNY